MININSDLLKVFGFWTSVLTLKLLAMAPLTARQRFAKKIFSNPEDAKLVHKGAVAFNDPDIERVRRAHLNDLENIPIWVGITLLWLTTNPPAWLAGNFIRAFVLARIAHTFTYAICPMQPFRAIAFFVGIGVTLSEAILTLVAYL